MKVVFKNGEIKVCLPPTEQKVFRASTAAGWLLMLVLTAEMTSAQLDSLVTPDNISGLVFTTDEGEEVFSISGYEKISSSVIRYAENSAETRVELQLMKGLPNAEN